MEHDAELKDGNSNNLGRGRLISKAMRMPMLVLVRMLDARKRRHRCSSALRGLDLFDVTLFLDDGGVRVLDRLGRPASASVAVTSPPRLGSVRGEGADAPALRVVRDAVPVRIVRYAQRGELRRSPAERDELDDEDAENANEDDG